MKAPPLRSAGAVSYCALQVAEHVRRQLFLQMNQALGHILGMLVCGLIFVQILIQGFDAHILQPSVTKAAAVLSEGFMRNSALVFSHDMPLAMGFGALPSSP